LAGVGPCPTRRFDAGSIPTDAPSGYPAKPELLERYREGHQDIERALRDAPPGRLEQPPGLERWAEGFGGTGHALQYLMVHHEAEHLGQIAGWRRAMGFGPLGD